MTLQGIGSIGDFIGGVCALVLTGIAIYGIRTWRQQIVGQHAFALARNIFVSSMHLNRIVVGTFYTVTPQISKEIDAHIDALNMYWLEAEHVWGSHFSHLVFETTVHAMLVTRAMSTVDEDGKEIKAGDPATKKKALEDYKEKFELLQKALAPHFKV